MREAFYADAAKRVVPVNLMEQELTAFGLAVWFMDDGALDRKQLRINTQCFSLDENTVLIEFLQAKFGIAARLNKDKDRYRLRIREDSVGRFKSLVGPHLIPNMLYKLPL
jgi:hypothetical protein